jgi:uncharacterized OB-fold protein
MNENINPTKLFKERVWVLREKGAPRLLGHKCGFCGELFFPQRTVDQCLHCHREGLKDVELGPWGKLKSFTKVMQPPAGGFYKGPVPFLYGLVDLDEGVRVETHLLGDLENMWVGARVKLCLRNLYKDEKNETVQIYAFELQK